MSTEQPQHTSVNIQQIVNEIRDKGITGPVTEQALRDAYSFPVWVAIPPLFITLVNNHMGFEGDLPESEGNDILGLFLGFLSPNNPKD
jgi:hypothetical protein